jgi:uncharacterized protein (DUF2384 family)
MSTSPQLGIPGIPTPEPSVSTNAQMRAYENQVVRAIDVFGDAITANRWLSTPSNDFNGKVPLQFAEEVDYNDKIIKEKFEPIFGRIEHGIYY